MASERSYEGSFTIPAPRGVYQAAGDTNVNAEYAYRAQNIRTEHGLLASSYGVSRAFPALGVPVETLTRFYRRTRPDDPDVYVASGGGKIYTYTMGGEGWVERGSGYLSCQWSAVTYEAVEDGATVDVLMLSNAMDGLVCLYGSDLRVEPRTLTIGDGGAEVKFAVLGRYAERIWGTGDENHPDSVFYSRPYNPLDWTADLETPELGGGMIQQPTWDGDAFIALEPFGGYLLAIRRRSVFELRGSDPGSFTLTQAYGTDGPVQGRSVCVDRLGMYYLSQAGLGAYDGATLQLLSRDALHETMRMRMEGMQENAVACCAGHVYYLALCVKEHEDDALLENNAVIAYDTQRGTFMLRTGVRVKDFYAIDGRVYFTQADSPYEILRFDDPKSGGILGTPMACLWETPWLDLGKARRKRDFVLRFTAEASENDVPLEVTMITDRGEKRGVVMLGARRKDYRVKIQHSGLRVKLRIASGKKAAQWQIHGGVQVQFTADEED